MIPIVAIVMSLGIPIAWFYFDSRNKRARYQAVEKLAQTVQDPTTIERILKDEREYRDRRRTPYHRGIVTAAIGAALLVARPPAHEGPPLWIGTLLLFVGIALLVSDFLNFGFRGRRGEHGDGPDGPGNLS
jgi:hypothetical protein